jgi:hypothetical protein
MLETGEKEIKINLQRFLKERDCHEMHLNINQLKDFIVKTQKNPRAITVINHQ